MYAFDVRQQFGVIVPAFAAAGAVQLVRSSPRRAALVFTAYGVGVVFALGYNVGDAHVFFLQSHVVLALLVAPGLVHPQGVEVGQAGYRIDQAPNAESPPGQDRTASDNHEQSWRDINQD